MEVVVPPEVARVITFYDEESEAEMELVSVSATGLCKCIYRNAHEHMEVRVARHRTRLRALNDVAREMLKAADTSNS